MTEGQIDTRQRVVKKYSGASAEAYDEIRLHDPKGLLLSEHDLRLFWTLFPKEQAGMKMLEVGAGTGRFTIPVVERGFTLTATDINEDMLKQLGEKLERMGKSAQCEIKIDDVFNLSFPDRTFDFAFGLHLFPRFLTYEDQRAALIETARVLKPGGRLLFNFRNSRSIYGKFHRGYCISPGEIKGILRDAGMRIEVARGKWILTKRTLQRLPMPINRLLAALDRALWSFWPMRAWDVFVVAVKSE